MNVTCRCVDCKAPEDCAMNLRVEEPVHPSYGSLDQFLAALAVDVRAGYFMRIGQQGAINWFAEQYSAKRAASSAAEGQK